MIVIQHLTLISGKDTRVHYLLPLAIFGLEKCALEKKRLTNDSQTLLRLERQMFRIPES